MQPAFLYHSSTRTKIKSQEEMHRLKHFLKWISPLCGELNTMLHFSRITDTSVGLPCPLLGGGHDPQVHPAMTSEILVVTNALLIKYPPGTP